MPNVKPIPEGYHTITPSLIVDDGVRALDFYKRAFGAVEIMRMLNPDGKLSHGEMRIGNSPFMVTDGFGVQHGFPPGAWRHGSVSVHVCRGR